MKIELTGGAIRLQANQTLRLVDSAGSTLCAVEGALWVTEQGQPRDVVLAKGECYRLARDGVAIVNALGSSAAVALN